MQTAARVAVSIFLLTSVIATAYRSYLKHPPYPRVFLEGSVKLRRDGVLNLYPFPRVGRSSRQTWQLPAAHGDLYYEYKPSHKRQLYAFPRVGRSDTLLREHLTPMRFEDLVIDSPRSHYSKRAETESESTDSAGMWFGPRLGRMFSDNDEDEVQLSNSDRSEPEQIESAHNEERKKRHTKSDM